MENIKPIKEDTDHLIKWISKHVGKLEEGDISIILIVKEYFIENDTHEISYDLFNKLHTKSKQKKLGITYTPEVIRRKLTRNVLNYFHPEDVRGLTICDPCCGTGLFTLTLLEELENFDIDIKTALTKNVFLYDLDKLSVAISLLNLYLFCKKRKIEIFDMMLNCEVKNFFENDTKFDAFITNPPYVKLQNLDKGDIEKFKIDFSKIFHGAPGLALLFSYKLLKDLKKNGILGIITQNNFFTSLAASKYRSEIRGYLNKIETFGNDLKFDGVNAYTCLLYLTEKENTNFLYLKNTDSPIESHYSTINTSELNNKKWRLGSRKQLQNLKILETKGVRLGDTSKIWVGIATQLDKAFLCEERDNIWYGKTKEGTFVQIDKEVVKKLIKISNFSNEKELQDNKIGIIFPYKQTISGKFELFEGVYFEKSFPKTYSYLESWREELLNRQKGNIAESEWYKWGRVQSMHSVEKKLLTKTFDTKPNFKYDQSDSLFSNGYALKPNEEFFDINFLKQILNSDIFYNYMKLTSFEIAGDYQCYQKNFIENFCIPKINLKLQKELVENDEVNRFISDYYQLT